MCAKSKFKFKNDSYTKRRGAPVMLIINCALCQTYLMHYQKDGPGPLLRCYLDRIHEPENLHLRQYLNFDKKTFPQLKCDSCSNIIGYPIIYEKENRPTYHMKVGSFSYSKI